MTSSIKGCKRTSLYPAANSNEATGKPEGNERATKENGAEDKNESRKNSTWKGRWFIKAIIF